MCTNTNIKGAFWGVGEGIYQVWGQDLNVCYWGHKYQQIRSNCRLAKAYSGIQEVQQRDLHSFRPDEALFHLFHHFIAKLPFLSMSSKVVLNRSA